MQEVDSEANISVISYCLVGWSYYDKAYNKVAFNSQAEPCINMAKTYSDKGKTMANFDLKSSIMHSK